MQEVDDKLILYGFLAGFALNLILAGQMVRNLHQLFRRIQRFLIIYIDLLLEQLIHRSPCRRGRTKAQGTCHGLQHRRNAHNAAKRCNYAPARLRPSLIYTNNIFLLSHCLTYPPLFVPTSIDKHKIVSQRLASLSMGLYEQQPCRDTSCCIVKMSSSACELGTTAFYR